MPRSRSRSGGFSRSPNRASFAPSRPMPQQQVNTRSPGMFSGFGSTLATGMAFGAGSEVAHQAVRGMMGSNYQQPGSQMQQQPTEQQQIQQSRQLNQQEPCLREINDFANCISTHETDIGSCQKLSEQLKECKQKMDMKK